MKLICPECKNQVDLSLFPELSVGQVLECQMCGISLIVTAVQGNDVQADIMDEGK